MSEALDPSLRNLNDCGCCEGLTAQTPLEVTNRAGLSAIAYRVGSWAQFKNTMLADLSATAQPALAGLRTRKDDDFSVALLDAWATVADVLTFYQERIANESYLATATERFSLLQLARLIGYELRPGVAASTYLAFTLEDAPGAPGRATIPSGTKVQSIPGPGEQPQTFETVEQIDARAAWNAIKPRLTKRHPITKDRDTFFFDGIATGLKAGDGLLISPDDGSDPIFRQVATVIPQPAQQRTQVTLQPLPAALLAFLALPTFSLIPPFSSGTAASGSISAPFQGQTLKASDLHSIAAMQRFKVIDLFNNLFATQPPPPSVQTFRTRASIFGYNAPDWNAVKSTYQSDAADWPFTAGPKNQLDLNMVYSQIIPDSWVVVRRRNGSTVIAKVDSATEVGVVNYTFGTKITRLELKTNEQAAPTSNTEIRDITVFAQSEELSLARLPIDDPVSGTQIELNGWVDGLFAGQNLIVCGESATNLGVQVCERATIANVEQVLDSDGFTRITLSNALSTDYVRATVTINANVALATHGETKQEVLGSGDASQSYQRFTLRQPPLTYISAPTPSGGASTLQVFVNEVQWHEAPAFYGRGPRERIFITRTGDDGKTTIEFGDGQTGARLPTSQENIKATYRKGIGLDGLVKAGQLSLLMTRPLGVKSVTNPEDASGAAERESLGDARRNAPLTVLTLDRIVSLQDYEDFARSFLGIAKALASWTWDGQVRGVFVTVAGPDGAQIPPDSDVYKNLLAAMQQAGDSAVPLRVQSYRPAFFRLAASVKINPDYQSDRVLAAVEQALRVHFSFDARAFGQGVTLSEVMAVMQQVQGVIAVDVDYLYRSEQTSDLKTPLLAAAPQPGADASVLAAELLTLDSAPLDRLGVMS